MGNRRQQGRAQPFGLGGSLDAIHILDQPHPFDRQRALVHQRVEQAALVRGEQRAGLVAVDADNADRAAPGMHRQEQPLGARQRIGAAPGGAVALPGPLGRRDIGIAECILRRIAGAYRERPVGRQQKHHAHFQHQCRLIGRWPKARHRACRRRRACG